MISIRPALAIVAIAVTGFIAAATPPAVFARDSLGVYADWAVFRDMNVPRCYAIARANPPVRESEKQRDYTPYISIGTWPERSVRNQLHLRLSRKLAPNRQIRLAIGSRRFNLTGGGGDAWAQNPAMDAAIIAAMRSATRLSVTATDASGKRFTNRYTLEGAATAIDAATLGCSPRSLQQAQSQN